tara:strand:+ start:241 stop:852 length:612 start_codon:yes stop_codon:yes gene_type:complete
MLLDLSTEEELSKYSLRRSNDIYLFSNVFSEDMCNKLVEYTNKNVNTRLKHEYGKNVQGQQKEIRYKSDPFYNPITSKIIDISHFIKMKYNIPVAGFDNHGIEESINLRKIDGPTRIHMDGPAFNMLNGDTTIPIKCLRSLSLIIALNGDYDGGEIVFPCQNFRTKLKQGEAIVFPPYWTHPHYTEDLKNNTFRYTVNTWVSV